MREVFKALYYERVSTTKEDQANSLVNQSALKDRFLVRHPEIVLVEQPYSETVSGKSDVRPEYQKMMERLKKGDIDYLLVKDLKRLCRSNAVSEQIKQMCQRYHFKLILTSTSQIYDPNSEEYRLMYGFEALINEEVVHRQSAYARIAHQQKCEAKKLNANNEKFGFKWDYTIDDMVIDKEEADILRIGFEMLVFQNLGMKEISEKFATEYGLTGKHSKKLVSITTLRKWFRDPACIGKFYFNQRGSLLEIGIGAKTKRYMKEKEEWVLVDRPDLQIIPTELFELAQRIMDERIHIYDCDKNGNFQDRFHGTHLFSSKVFCGKCGYSLLHYYTDRKQTISAYKDSYTLKAKSPDKLKCSNEYNRIYEDALIEIAKSSINGLLQEHEKCFDILSEVLEKAIKTKERDNSKQKLLEKQMEELEKQSEKIMDSYLEATGMMKQALADKYEKNIEELQKIKREHELEITNSTKKIDYGKRIEEVRNALTGLKEINTLDKETIDNFIRKIVINENGTMEVYLRTKTIVKQQIQTWEEQKQARKGSVSRALYTYNRFFYENVVKKEVLCTAALCQQVMQIILPICSSVWKQ